MDALHMGTVDRMLINVSVMKTQLNNTSVSDVEPSTLVDNINNHNTTNTINAINKGQYDMKKFQMKMKTYHDDKNMKKGLIEVPISTAKVITDFDEIENLDKGKPWKRLDNWMKLKYLKEYAITQNKDANYIKLIIKLFNTGEFKLTQSVEYDAANGCIIQIKSEKLLLLEANL